MNDAKILWIYRLYINNLPLLKKNIIHPRAFEKATFMEDDPMLHIKCLDNSGLICDLMISNKPLKYIKTIDYKPISLKNSEAWIFSMDTKCSLNIQTSLFNWNNFEDFGFSMIGNINYNKKFINTFIKDHPELISTFINLSLIKNQFWHITSTPHYDYNEATYIQKEIEKRLL